MKQFQVQMVPSDTDLSNVRARYSCFRLRKVHDWMNLLRKHLVAAEKVYENL